VKARSLPRRRHVLSAAEVTLLGLFLDVYGDRAVWPESVRREYASAVAQACTRSPR
jgi:hypothetical protein